MAPPKKPVKVDAQKRSLGIQKKAKDQGKLDKSNTRAGKGKGSTAARKLQNAEVADGTIRIGKGGKSYNVYDKKSGTWKRGVVSTAKPKPTGSTIKDKKASRIGGYTPGTKSQTLPNTGWWSNNKYPAKY